MKERLQELLIKFGYSATRLADEISVQRSGISHILSGRNQPSYEFLVKLLKRFPDINAEWLILGKGKMLRTQQEKQILRSETLPGLKITEDLFDKREISPTNQPEIKTSEKIVTNVAGIRRIILLNSDGTFDVYHQSGNN